MPPGHISQVQQRLQNQTNINVRNIDLARQAHSFSGFAFSGQWVEIMLSRTTKHQRQKQGREVKRGEQRDQAIRTEVFVFSGIRVCNWHANEKHAE